MAHITRTFSDLDLNFIPHPVTNDIVRRYDENAVKTSVKNLILTGNFERPFRSDIGTPIKHLLFQVWDSTLPLLLKRVIEDTITNFEPRVVLLNTTVQFSPDNNSLYVTITFRIVNTTNPIDVNVVLERTR